MANCRSCGAPIWWARSRADRRLPIDQDPTPGGNLVVATAEGDVLDGAELDEARAGGQSYVVVVAEGMAPGVPRWVTHFATCPNAKAHRR